MSDQELIATMRALIEEHGVDRASKILGINRQTVGSIVAGLPVRAGSKALCRENLAKRATAGAPRPQG